jgi:hypothetical protein
LLVIDLIEQKFGPTLARTRVPAAAAGALLMIPAYPASTPGYDAAARAHGFHYIQRWAWYELVGLIAPIALFWWFARIAREKKWRNVERLSRAFIVYDVIYILAALVIDLPARFEALARIQPLRSLHLLYIVMLVILGGVLGEFVLKSRPWRWLLLLLPLCVGMFAAQRALFPASAVIEWPGVAPKNLWGQAFVWVRDHISADAVFALDPEHMDIYGEDEIGFRCLAQRSRIADNVKDNGVVSMFPNLAPEWWAQIQEERGWKSFTRNDFGHLKKDYGVNWVVLQQPGLAGLDCLYQNSAVRVCRVP